MIIKSAEFITSAVHPDQYPSVNLPEIAFAGRSNVGKSSLINCLVNRKSLVKTSATPGKTRLINFFDINQAVSFVDLPGYGYAKVSKKEKKKWGPMVETYLSRRESLKGVLLLLDLRRVPRDEDFQMMEWLDHYDIPGKIILTKADKLKKNARKQQYYNIAEKLEADLDDFILFSSKSRLGRETTIELIDDLVDLSEPSLTTTAKEI